MKASAKWRQERPSDSAVKDPAPFLHSIPGGDPCLAPPDQMHTWHHGVGREFTSSCIVLCACHWRLWGGANIERRLALAYDDFRRWRVLNKTNSSINKFELKTFKMTSPLGKHAARTERNKILVPEAEVLVWAVWKRA